MFSNARSATPDHPPIFSPPIFQVRLSRMASAGIATLSDVITLAQPAGETGRDASRRALLRFEKFRPELKLQLENLPRRNSGRTRGESSERQLGGSGDSDVDGRFSG